MSRNTLMRTIVISISILTFSSCDRESNLYGEWVCVSGNFYNGAKFWFLKSKILVISSNRNEKRFNYSISSNKLILQDQEEKYEFELKKYNSNQLVLLNDGIIIILKH